MSVYVSGRPIQSSTVEVAYRFLRFQVYFRDVFQNISWVYVTCLFDLFGGAIPTREVLLYLYVAESVPASAMYVYGIAAA